MLDAAYETNGVHTEQHGRITQNYISDKPQPDPVETDFGDVYILGFEGISTKPNVAYTQDMMSRCKKAIGSVLPPDPDPRWTGHTDNNHIALVPLTNVGHAYADGRIMGAAVIVPEEANREDRQAFFEATSEGLTVDGGPWNFDASLILPRSYDDVPKTLQPHESPCNLKGPASKWSTVTPVVMTAFADDKTREDIIREDIQRVGAPPIEHIEIGPHGPGQKIPKALDFDVWNREERHDGLSDHNRWHVSVEFESPVKGPLVVGQGRYYGLGLLTPDTA